MLERSIQIQVSNLRLAEVCFLLPFLVYRLILILPEAVLSLVQSHTKFTVHRSKIRPQSKISQRSHLRSRKVSLDRKKTPKDPYPWQTFKNSLQNTPIFAPNCERSTRLLWRKNGTQSKSTAHTIAATDRLITITITRTIVEPGLQKKDSTVESEKLGGGEKAVKPESARTLMPKAL